MTKDQIVVMLLGALLGYVAKDVLAKPSTTRYESAIYSRFRE